MRRSYFTRTGSVSGFIFIYYDIVHEVQGNIKINEFEWKNGKTASKII